MPGAEGRGVGHPGTSSDHRQGIPQRPGSSRARSPAGACLPVGKRVAIQESIVLVSWSADHS